MSKHIIYTNDSHESYEELVKQYCEHLELNEIPIPNPIPEQEVYDFAADEDNRWFEDQQVNLDKELPNRIVALASVGTWRGKRTGYKDIGYNLKDILQSYSCDFVTFFVEDEEVQFIGHHHDGTNTVTFRVPKEGLRFCPYCHTETESELCPECEHATEDPEIRSGWEPTWENTESIAKYVKEIYGW